MKNIIAFIMIYTLLITEALAMTSESRFCSQQPSPNLAQVDDQCAPGDSLPVLGKWMLTVGNNKYYTKEQVANWLGQLNQAGYHIIEPNKYPWGLTHGY